MKASGALRKMLASLKSPVEYTLRLSDEKIPLNEFINRNISLTFNGEINCVQCGRKTSKSFQQGYCFPCLRHLQECNLCIIRPEKCKFYEGNCDPNDWAHVQCGQPHVIYLANTSALKVGITRETNVPTRWIDQGAVQAIPFIDVQNRYQSGLVEMIFKNYVADKTNWRNMLKGVVEKIDLIEAKEKLLHQADTELEKLFKKYHGEIKLMENPKAIDIDYPVLQFPEKITSLNFDKQQEVAGKLLGIKGQYLILDVGVINLRKFGGYHVTFSAS